MPPMTGRVLAMQKPIPENEGDRLAESVDLLMKLKEHDVAKMTTWEVELLAGIKEGKAVTRIRLLELRDIVKRLYPE
jgi:hypothetical protein